MSPCWQLTAGADPALHTWQGEYIVHHALSNDTHRLSESAGRILLELAAAGSQGVRDPGQSLALSDEEARTTLTALADLGFVTQC